MKSLLEFIIRFRNPEFRFDVNLSSMALFAFFWQQGWALIRGLQVLFMFKNPKMAMLGSGVRLQHAYNLHFGKFLKLGEYVHLNALGKDGIRLGNNVGIGAYSRLIVATSLNQLGKGIRLGHNVGIGEFAYLGGAGGLEIGDDCIIGQYLSCHPENHNYSDNSEPIRQQGVTRQGIKIGRNCWIGSKVTILDGVNIGNGCVVAAGAIVTRSFPDNSIIGGVPARLIKQRTS